MIEKALEAFFRHWALILLPLLVIPMDVAAWVFSTPPQYEAQAAVWVERPTYLSYSGDELTRYLPPATVQRNRLMELMRTRSFMSAVVADTGLAPLLDAPNGTAQLDTMFTRDFDVVQSGDHLLEVYFRSESSSIALSTVNSVIEQFRARASDDRKAQAQLAISFYQARLTDAESALSQARTDLSKYLSANPKVAVTLAQNGLESARLDAGFAELQRKVDTAGRDADSARGSLQSAQLDVSAGNQTDALGFRVVDGAGVSSAPSRQLKKLVIYPIAALIAAMALSAALLLLFTLSDHSVRSLADLAPDTVILGVLPRLRPVRSTRVVGGHATRRALGHVAGSAALTAPDRTGT